MLPWQRAVPVRLVLTLRLAVIVLLTVMVRRWERPSEPAMCLQKAAEKILLKKSGTTFS